jgi:hypothetical protein
VKVRHDEGVAIHIGPESCAGSREAVREALTGEHAGQVWSRERMHISGADAVPDAEGNTNGDAIASSRSTRRGRRPWHAWTFLAREPGDLVIGQSGPPLLVRIGKARSRSR